MREMRSSEQTNELAAALAKAQGQMKAAKKSEANPYFHSKYADLPNMVENDRRAIADNGLSIVQGACTMFGPAGAEVTAIAVGVTTRLLHTSGQWIEDTLFAIPKDFTPQIVGACVTYLRRYGRGAIIQSTAEGEDDDGETAQGRGNEKPINPNYVKVKPEGTLPNKTNEKNPIDEKLESLRARFTALKTSGYFTQEEMRDFNAQVTKFKAEKPSLEHLIGKWELELAGRKASQQQNMDAIFDATDGQSTVPAGEQELL